jgi:ADP-ribosyl-[dinitrogen reductase] hydrolase
MRISPLGVFGWWLPARELAELAARDSRLSHPPPLCQAACAVFACAIGYAVRTGASAKEVHGEAMRIAREEPLAAPALEVLEAAAETTPADFQSQMGWVRIALQNAFHQLLRAESAEEAVVATAAQGGDSDTNACIAGALAGAVHGARAIPERWSEKVLSCRTDRPPEYWCVDLPELARKLCSPAQAGGADGEAR